jgi:dTDP-4-dehydrorhamnose reductase
MARILITGANGQLGQAFRKLSMHYPEHQFLFTDCQELDITDYQQIDKVITSHPQDFIINCAAYTAVDKAEDDQHNARFLNANAVRYLAQLSKRHNYRLIHISTDYVFNGNQFQPYNETDNVSPTSFYGKSKLEGEQEVLTHAENATIIRTSWLYSEVGGNFVKTIRKYGRERGELKVVFDQIGTPTFATDLAQAIINALPEIRRMNGIELFHFSNEGVCSWFDFAKEIIEKSNITCKINPVTSDEYPTSTKRPFYSVLNKKKWKTFFNTDIPYWKDSLQLCIDLLDEQERA